MKKLFKFLPVILVFLAFISCKKEAPTFPFTILVTNEDNLPLPNVFVEATADVPNAIPDFSGITNEDGIVRFEYDLEAVLKVRATRSSNPPTWMGCNFIKLEPNTDVQIKVILQPYNPTQPGC